MVQYCWMKVRKEIVLAHTILYQQKLLILIYNQSLFFYNVIIGKQQPKTEFNRS